MPSSTSGLLRRGPSRIGTPDLLGFPHPRACRWLSPRAELCSPCATQLQPTRGSPSSKRTMAGSVNIAAAVWRGGWPPLLEKLMFVLPCEESFEKGY